MFFIRILGVCSLLLSVSAFTGCSGGAAGEEEFSDSNLKANQLAVADEFDEFDAAQSSAAADDVGGEVDFEPASGDLVSPFPAFDDAGGGEDEEDLSSAEVVRRLLARLEYAGYDPVELYAARQIGASTGELYYLEAQVPSGRRSIAFGVRSGAAAKLYLGDSQRRRHRRCAQHTGTSGVAEVTPVFRAYRESRRLVASHVTCHGADGNTVADYLVINNRESDVYYLEQITLD